MPAPSQNLISSKTNIVTNAWIGLALGVGILARISMWLSQKSFWGDEWFSIQLAKAPSAADALMMAVRDVHPPLYYLALRLVVEIFGNTEVALRSVSCAAGIGTLLILTELTRRYVSASAAVICAWLLAISPYWLQSANEVRSYALMAFWVTAGTYAFCRCRETGASKLWAIIYAAVSAAAIYTEHYSWFWVLAVTGYLVLEWMRGSRYTALIKVQCAVIIAGLPSLALIGYQAIFGEKMFDVTRVSEYWNLGWMAKKIAGIYWHFSCGYEFAMLTTERVQYYAAHSPYFWVSAAIAMTGIVFFICGLTTLFRERPFFFWTSLFGLVVPVTLLWVLYPIRLHARYLSFGAPWFFLVVAVGISGASRYVRVVVLAGFVVVGAAGTWIAVNSLTDRVHREDYLNQTRYILTHADPTDAVVVTEPQFSYYQQKLGLLFTGSRFAGLAAMTTEKLQGVDRIWVPELLNMNPGVSERIFKEICSRMRGLDFVPSSERRIFGGREALTVLYVFDRAQPDNR